MDKQILDKLKYLINKKKPLNEICGILGKETYQIYEMILYLKHMGFNYDIIDGVPQKVKNPGITYPASSLAIDQNEEIVFLADPHYGSVYDRPDIMDYIYAECDKRGIRYIFCAGDFTDGYYPQNPQNAYMQKVHGAMPMIDYVTHTHPYSKNITFFTLSGNHDDMFLKTDGISICAEIAKVRPDIVYLGGDSANITFGPVKMFIAHGYGSKRRDLRVEHYTQMFSDDAKPDIIALGHIHQAFYETVGSTHILQTGALINFGENRKRKCDTSDRSCFFTKFSFDEDGNLEAVNPELKKFGRTRVRRK